MPNEFSNSMVESVENLIVKTEAYLPKGEKIHGKCIESWKDYTFKYFQQSPKFFLADNETYQRLSSNLRKRLVKKHILVKFQERFDVFFIDPEFGFKADDLLITHVVASLEYHHVDPGESILILNEVASAIYFIYAGQCQVSYKHQDDVKLLLFEPGSYFGDTSLIFGIRNQYKYVMKQSQNGVPTHE